MMNSRSTPQLPYVISTSTSGSTSTHYGSEFSCPVSLLRVYGLTHLEEWKWDSKPDRYEQLLIPAHALPRKPDAESLSPTPTTLDAAVDTPLVTQTPDPPTEPSAETQHLRMNAGSQPSGDTTAPVPEPTSTPQDTRPDTSSTPLVNVESVHVTATDQHQPPPSSVSHPTSNPSQSTQFQPRRRRKPLRVSLFGRHHPFSLSSNSNHIVGYGSLGRLGTAESIYRMIMDRIAMLDLNPALYTRHAEDHMVGVRELLKRLTEEVGRLEGIVRYSFHPIG